MRFLSEKLPCKALVPLTTSVFAGLFYLYQMQETPTPNYYGIITADVRYDNELPAMAKLLYSEITALSNAKGFCYASNGYFAKLYEMNAGSISRLFSQLEKRGHIRINLIRDEKGTSRNIYPIHKIVQGGTQKCVGGATKSFGGLHENVHHNIKENNKENTKEDIRANKLPEPIASDSVFENKSNQEALPLKAEPTPEKEKSCAKKEKEPKRTFVAEFRDVMATFETLTPNRFKVPTTDALIKRSGKYVLVHARLLEGYTVEDLKAVISTKSKEWSDSPKMKQYLTPDTLFAKRNIEKYLDQHHSEQANAQPVARPRPMADADFYNKIANSQKL